MNSKILKISEFSWLSIVVAVMTPIALVGWANGTSWVNVKISSPIVELIVFIVFIVSELYLLARGVWPKELTVDLNQNEITIKAYCPFIFKPTVIPIKDIKKIRVGSHLSGGDNLYSYGLVIVKNDDSEVMFGDDTDSDREKHERWRDEIAEFSGIDNITRQSS